MDYGDNSDFQNMSGYGTPATNCPEAYPGFSQLGDGYGDSRQYGNSQQQWAPEEGRGCQGGSAAFGGPGYRSPLRYNRILKEINSRNGLYSPTEQRSAGMGNGNGDYYNSLPGLGGYEGQMMPRGSNRRNQWY